ncbi:filamentous hemagglutinin family outer membrane protein [Calothrix sp. NIES-2100]|uniref:two-partner secretion domain-containing protein n=1 Tax=Calothrix sp. NIES-2100 TaxID=1954172 RepID=UPI000B6099AB|nr:filamentous hemagglutinin family outer membrane protein [Calothrix sp. NIES-2100]
MRFIPFLLGFLTGSLTYLNLTPGNLAIAQITPDNTLGAEKSVVTPNQIIKGIPSDRIDGGAIRAGNLFHSFTDFNIRAGKGAYFTNPSGIENILTRVTGSNVSQILGTLGVLGNANLFFVNPNGIIFGQNARLDVNGSFVGSAGKSFVLGNGWEFSATNPQAPPLLKINVPIGLQREANGGDIANGGNLAVNLGKNLTLFGNTVTSTGALIAPGGTVQLLGERVGLFAHALIDVSADLVGGKVLIGGDDGQRIYIAPDVNIHADAQTLGNGGSIIILAEDTAQIYGNISTRGGLLGGNGGFIETSGHQFLDITTTPDMQAPRGIGGNWLIDPNNIEIVAAGTGNNNITATNPFQTTGDTSRIEVNVIVNALKSGNVTISTTAAGANSQAGDITLNAKLDFNGIGTGKTLTLNAQNNILINAPIADSNTLTTDSLNLVLNGNSDRTGFGRVELVPSLFSPDDSISTGGGDIAIQGNGDTNPGILTVVPINSGGGNISLTGTSVNKQGIFIISPINSAGGNINLLGDSNNLEGIFHVSSLDSGNGDITLTADRNFIVGTVTGSGNLLIQPLTPSLNLELGRNDIDLSATFLHNYELSRFTDGFAAITIGRADGSGTINLLGNVTFPDPVILRSPLGNGNIIVNKSVLATGSLTLEAAKDIIFNNGANINPLVKPPDIFAPVNLALKADNINLINSRFSSSSGTITLDARSLSMNNSYLSSSSFGENGSGAIKVTADSVAIGNSTIESQTLGKGDGGAITIDAGSMAMENNSRILTQSFGAGNGGSINIIADAGFILNDSSISSANDSLGDRGQVDILANSIAINRSSLLSNGRGSGSFPFGVNINATGDSIIINDSTFTSGSSGLSPAGAININAANSVSMNNNFIDSRTLGAQNGGAINITASAIAMNQTFIRSSSFSGVSVGGKGGDINISATNSILLDNKSFITSSTFNTGDSGAISLTAHDLINIKNNSLIRSSTLNAGNAGVVNLSADQIFIDSSNIRGETSTTGNAGSILIKDASSVLLSNNSSISSETSNAGAAGDITITTDTLNINSQAKVSATATATATTKQPTGKITVNAAAVTLSGGGGLFAETAGVAPAGSIILQPNDNQQTLNLQLSDGGKISALTSGNGNAGNLIVTAPEAINIHGDGQLTVETSNNGSAGDINIITKKLTIPDGSQISASTSSSGKGGNLTVNAADFALLQNQSRLLTQATGTGTAGNITINTPQLNLLSGAKISANTISSVGGDIQLQGLQTLEVNNSQISASTQTGKAGNLRVNAAEAVELSAGALTVAATGKDGVAGDLTVKTGQFNLANHAQVTVSSPQGQAGNVDITANSLFLNQGIIAAETGNSDTQSGANIRLQISDWLQLQNESLISATANNIANGGNINIDTKFLIAFPSIGTQGSDIIANAEFGNGGKININAEGVLGIQFRPAQTRFNDFTVSSEFGTSGEVEINRAIDPSVGLTQLPKRPVQSQLSQACKPQKAENQSEFFITGRGGLPDNPYGALQTDSTIKQWVTVDEGKNITDNHSNINRMSNQTPAAIVEAQGMIVDENGDISLVAQVPQVTPHSPTLTAVACSGFGIQN